MASFINPGDRASGGQTRFRVQAYRTSQRWPVEYILASASGDFPAWAVAREKYWERYTDARSGIGDDSPVTVGIATLAD